MSYRNPLPSSRQMLPFQVDVSSRYGAPMGRREAKPKAPYEITGKVHLRKVRLNGDYDQGGAYWGAGETLWCMWNDDVVQYTRAPTREIAKQIFSRGMGASNLKFYR